MFLILQTLATQYLSPISILANGYLNTEVLAFASFFNFRTGFQIYTHRTVHIPIPQKQDAASQQEGEMLYVIIWFVMPDAKQKWDETLGR